MADCELCGEPMPPGEEMFRFHGYSGTCPKPLLPQLSVTTVLQKLIAADVWFSHRQVQEHLANPDWKYSQKYGDWRNHVDSTLRNLWAGMSEETRLAIYYQAVQQARYEPDPED